MKNEKEDISFKDFCIGCGHYHRWDVMHGKRAYYCTMRTECTCKDFIGRSFKRSFA